LHGDSHSLESNFGISLRVGNNCFLPKCYVLINRDYLSNTFDSNSAVSAIERTPLNDARIKLKALLDVRGRHMVSSINIIIADYGGIKRNIVKNVCIATKIGIESDHCYMVLTSNFCCSVFIMIILIFLVAVRLMPEQ
jgi:hypothetical protein